MNPYQSVRDFEKAMREYTDARFAVAMESCSAALFLCCEFYKQKGHAGEIVTIPKHTYPSVAAGIVHAGMRVEFTSDEWQHRGWYRLGVTPIIDSAKYVARDMMRNHWEDHVCISFHAKKPLPIGRGGMVLTRNGELAQWLECMRHDGRHDGIDLHKDTLTMAGWNFLMQPEQASRGLTLLGSLPDEVISPEDEYADLSKYDWWNNG